MFIKRQYQQSKNTNHRMRENICKSYIWQEINIQNLHRTPKNQQQKYNSTLFLTQIRLGQREFIDSHYREYQKYSELK